MSLNDLKRRIIDEIPITDVVGNYVALSRKGTATICLCPFHDDSEPSLNVSNEKRYFKCFACNTGGNAIDFVMKYKDIDFVDAMKEIAKSHGIPLDDYITQKQKPPKVSMAEKILSKSCQLYRKLSQTGKHEKYSKFIKNRGLNEEIASTYSLGYAPKHSALTEYLSSIPNEKDRGFALQVAEEIGLIRRDQKNPKSHYDTFRERIIFPIWDHFGHVVGYTSRAVFDYQKAKYMNSKESFVFNKRDILYGLHLAKKSIRAKDAVILVEGNMDQIALHAKGFENAVAVMGIALGENSLRNIKALTTNVYLCLDTDEAGYKAATRINQQCLEVGIVPKYVNFAPHKDPDDFLQAEGALALQKKLDEASSFIDAHLENIMPDVFPELLDRQLELLEKCFEVVSPLKESLAATERLMTWAKRIGLQSSSDQIINNYHQFLNNSSRPQPVKAVQNQEVEPPFPMEDEYMPMPEEVENYHYEEMSADATSNLSKAERTLMQELLLHPECLTRKEVTELLDFVGSNEVKRYVLRLKDIVYEIDESEYVPVVTSITKSEGYSDEIQQVASQSLAKFRHTTLDDNIVARLLRDIKKKLQEDKLKTAKEELKRKKQDCKTQEEMNSLMLELLNIEKELNKLRSQKPIKS
jgi:DNA primase